LTAKELKQIGGRAGRFQSEYPEGLVTAMDSTALTLIKKALTTDISAKSTPELMCRQAGLFPLLEQLALFDQALGGEAPFSALLVRNSLVTHHEHLISSHHSLAYLVLWLVRASSTRWRRWTGNTFCAMGGQSWPLPKSALLISPHLNNLYLPAFFIVIGRFSTGLERKVHHGHGPYRFVVPSHPITLPITPPILVTTITTTTTTTTTLHMLISNLRADANSITVRFWMRRVCCSFFSLLFLLMMILLCLVCS